MRPARRASLVIAPAVVAAAFGAAAPAGAATPAAPRFTVPIPGATGCPSDADCDGFPDAIDRYPNDPLRWTDEAPIADDTPAVVRIELPRRRTVTAAKSVTVRASDPESKLRTGRYVLTRDVRSGTRTRSETWNGRRWDRTALAVPLKVRDRAAVAVKVPLKQLKPGSYRLTVSVSNRTGRDTTKTARFRLR
ncbi:hypothetical protein [Patulibacter sp. SYSU D01012]|uniref:hypothetical protein n=1 Tax=Patulibacter sp. SYSU D01012 TaxID=2817381 RepID=UPI001B30E458|nr:hypothetical protein [Patulibacter sp. SYSU D01012]